MVMLPEVSLAQGNTECQLDDCGVCDGNNRDKVVMEYVLAAKLLTIVEFVGQPIRIKVVMESASVKENLMIAESVVEKIVPKAVMDYVIVEDPLMNAESVAVAI